MPELFAHEDPVAFGRQDLRSLDARRPFAVDDENACARSRQSPGGECARRPATDHNNGVIHESGARRVQKQKLVRDLDVDQL